MLVSLYSLLLAHTLLLLSDYLIELRAEVHGMVHCTGGAQTKVLHFVGDNCCVIKDNMFPVPPLFRAIKDCSGTDWKEMYRYLIWGIAWKFMFVQKLQNKL